MHTFTKIGNAFPGLKSILEKLPDGVYEAPRKHDPNRNLSQNALLHGYLTYVAKESGNTMESLKTIMKKKFASKKKLVKLGKKKYYSNVLEHTSKMSKSRFSEFFRDVETFLTDFGYPLPDRNNPDFLSLCEEGNHF